MIRTGRYKYLAFSAGADPEMLFDLDRDPLETTNLAKAPDCYDILAEHRARLKEWAKATDDDFAVGAAQL